MQFLKCACYLAGLGILSFVLGRLVPKTWFDYTRFPYRTFAFERNGKLYEALRVSRWQSRVPDMSRLFPKLMPPKKMPAAGVAAEDQYLHASLLLFMRFRS